MRILQGIGLWVLFITVTAGLVALADAGRSACELKLSFQSAGCFLRQYKEIVIGVLATGGAIFAAWIAWIAIQRQIRHDEEIAASDERAALDASKIILREEFLETFNALWRAIDLALMRDEEVKTVRRIAIADTAIRALPELKGALTPLEELLVNLRPLEKRKLALVLTAIRWVYQASAGVWRPEQGGVKLKLTIMRTMLSHLHVYVTNFDPGLAAIFEDRTKAAVSHTPTRTGLIN